MKLVNKVAKLRLPFMGLCVLLLLQHCTKPENKSASARKAADTVVTAIRAQTQFLEKDGRKIAYRKIGKGNPIILCNRFRGILDDWDPLFIDSLATTNQVVIFDYAGIGRSTFRPGVDTLKELLDVRDIADGLGFKTFDLLGWSHGGKVAQVFTAKNPDRVRHLILLGTGPLGKPSFAPEQAFFDRALKPVNDFDDEIVLFFEPGSEKSKMEAKASHDRMAARKDDRDVYTTPDKFQKYFESVAAYNADEASKSKLSELTIPILALSGDHDIVFPIANWYEQTHVNPNLQIIMLPQSGHGPQSQYPVLTARYIQAFITM